MKDFMNRLWTAQTLNGKAIVERRVGYGSVPDIIVTTQDGKRHSGFDLFKKMVDIKLK